MPGYGAPPSEDRPRRTRTGRIDNSPTLVSAEGRAEAPPLPDRYPKVVQDWYATWASSPQAQTFTVTDWQRLHMLAPLVARYFKAPDKALMAEIRLNESLLGATHVDRLRARIKLAPENTSAPAPSVPDEVGARRRERILGAS